MSLSGFVNVLKPPGMTSHDVVSRIRRFVPRRTKVGHLGTLDPAAAGVLPVAVGQATKLISLLPDLGGAMKGYLGHIKLGLVTSTDDLEGEVLSRSSHQGITALEVERGLAGFQGEISQIPPQVSAIRKDGVRAYQRVRKGETVELPPRRVLIQSLKLLEYRGQSGIAQVHMVCGTGTYVRSVARDLGEALGVGGTLAFLLRTHSGPFQLDDAASLEELGENGLASHLQAMSFPFAHLPEVEVSEPVRQKGQKVRGDFPAAARFRCPQGLLRRLDGETGTAVVEALFEGAS